MRRDGIGSITAIDGRGCPAFKMRSSIFKPVLIDHLIPVNRWNLSLLKPAPPVKKEKKVYFYNHAILTDTGVRLENAVALALQKWISALNEQALGPYALHYLRDQDRREVDFLLTKNNKPILMIEVKQSELKPSTAGLYYQRKLKIPFVQVVGTPGVKRKTDFGAVLSVHYLLGVCG